MTLGDVYHSLSEYASMKVQMQRASELREKALGPGLGLTLASEDRLADALHHVGQFRESISRYRKIIEIRERQLGPNHPDILGFKKGLAVAYEAAGQSERALPLFEQNVQTWTDRQGPEGSGTVSALSNLCSSMSSGWRWGMIRCGATRDDSLADLAVSRPATMCRARMPVTPRAIEKSRPWRAGARALRPARAAAT
jgi:tetratricopeptide (TPR) repeat protein